MQRQCEAGREEEADRDHVRRIVMKIAELVAGVRHPIEMRNNPVREAVAPRAHQNRSDHLKSEIGEDREGEGDGDVKADCELPADLDLAQRPGDERAERAYRDELPEAAFVERRER